MKRLHLIALTACIVATSGCAATTYSQRVGDRRMSGAFEQPFADSGWTRENPPQVLIHAAEAPYALPGDAACAAILDEVAALDQVLGPDLDAEDHPGEEFGENARSFVIGAVADAIGGVVGLPYRSIVRRVSGANRRERTLREAIFAGMVRRAFLKGVARTACAPNPADNAVVLPTEPEANPSEALDAPPS